MANNLVKIPCDVYEYVLDYLPIVDLLSCLVATKETPLNELESDNAFWDNVLLKHTCWMGIHRHECESKVVLCYDSEVCFKPKMKLLCCSSRLRNYPKCDKCRKRVLKDYYIKQESQQCISKHIVLRMIFTEECQKVIEVETDSDCDTDTTTEREDELLERIQSLQNDLYEVCAERDELLDRLSDRF